MNEHKPRIFLCHAKEDKPRVRGLYHQLKKAGYHPWMDEEDLLPGADWELEIRRAIRGSVLFLACLSQKSLNRRGYVHKEIKIALDELDRMPEGKIYLIPVRLEECQVPDRLLSRQWVDLFKPDGFEKLKGTLDFESRTHRSPRQPFEPEMILIPAGEFLMGSNPAKDTEAYDREQPQHFLYLPDYYLSKTPVTNIQYLAFVQATGGESPSHWTSGKPRIGEEDNPVVGITWYEAQAYCNWLAEATGKLYLLPSEAEWEKGARGTDGRIYPWGDQWDPKLCNSKEGGEGDTVPVNSYPGGASPYGILDTAGNKWEWTRSLWGKGARKPTFRYPYDPSDGRENQEAEGNILRVVRGGSFEGNRIFVRCAYRTRYSPKHHFKGGGFRVCIVPQQD